MPDWTFNKIVADTQTVNKMKEKYSNSEGDFDFNKLFPMPEELNVTAGGQNDADIYYYLSEKMTIPHEEVKTNPLATLIHNYFSPDWISEIKQRIESNKITPDYDAGKRLCENYLNYGATTWYDWCCANWGTKWNACDSWWRIYDFGFDTAWAAPHPIFEQICKDFPDEAISFESEYEEGFIEYYENLNGELNLVKKAEIVYD